MSAAHSGATARARATDDLWLPVDQHLVACLTRIRIPGHRPARRGPLCPLGGLGQYGDTLLPSWQRVLRRLDASAARTLFFTGFAVFLFQTTFTRNHRTAGDQAWCRRRQGHAGLEDGKVDVRRGCRSPRRWEPESPLATVTATAQGCGILQSALCMAVRAAEAVQLSSGPPQLIDMTVL